ncbi:MAG: translin family protein [Nanoarchaeota archaeon]
MIDEKEFLKLKSDFDRFEEQREELIKKSRDILRFSKHAIFSVHNNELENAREKLVEAEKLIKETCKVKCSTKLDSIGALSSAMQEYVEAKCYLSYMEKKKLPTQKALKVEVDDYLLGLCDLTGELARRAVVTVTNNNTKEVYVIRGLVEKIFELMLQLNLRNGELRKKSDAIKWNLKKIEGIIYDLKIKGIENSKD